MLPLNTPICNNFGVVAFSVQQSEIDPSQRRFCIECADHIWTRLGELGIRSFMPRSPLQWRDFHLLDMQGFICSNDVKYVMIFLLRGFAPSQSFYLPSGFCELLSWNSGNLCSWFHQSFIKIQVSLLVSESGFWRVCVQPRLCNLMWRQHCSLRIKKTESTAQADSVLKTQLWTALQSYIQPLALLTIWRFEQTCRAQRFYKILRPSLVL